MRTFLPLVLLTLCLLLQASAMGWHFPGGGAPNLVQAAVLLIAFQRGRFPGLLTGAWGGFLVGALGGSGALPMASFYAAIGWMVGELGRPRLIRAVLLAAGVSLVATAVEAVLTGGPAMGQCALVSLAPQMLFQICVVTLDAASPVLL